MSKLLPYENRGETISVGLDFLDTEKTDIGTHSFLVDRSKLNGPFPIRVEAQLPDAIGQAFPPSERSAPPMAVIATVKSIDGLLRTQVPLKQSKKSLYCESACNKDPLFGVIGFQSGPRNRGSTLASMILGSRGWDAGRGDDCKDPPRVF